MEPGLKKESAGVEKATNNNNKSNVAGVEEDGIKSTKQPEPDDNVCATLNLTKVLFLYFSAGWPLVVVRAYIIYQGKFQKVPIASVLVVSVPKVSVPKFSVPLAIFLEPEFQMLVSF